MVRSEGCLVHETSNSEIKSLLIENVYLMHKQPQCQHYRRPTERTAFLMDKTKEKRILSRGSEDKVLKAGMWISSHSQKVMGMKPQCRICSP